MVEYVTREEFEARVGVLEQEVEGEKLVTRHVLEQTRRNGDDLAAIKTRLDRVERKVDGSSKEVTSLKGAFQELKGAFQDLTKSLSTIVAQAMRDVLQERDKKT